MVRTRTKIEGLRDKMQKNSMSKEEARFRKENQHVKIIWEIDIHESS